MFKKNSALWLAILITVLFLVLAVARAGFIESLELTTYDWRMHIRASGAEAQSDIVIVDIDDDAITKLGRWPWPRTMIAQVIDKLHANGAAFIGLNIIFSEPETPEGYRLIEDLKTAFSSSFDISTDPKAMRFLDSLAKAQDALDSDKRLTMALKSAGNVVLPVYFQFGKFAQPNIKGMPETIRVHGLNGLVGHSLNQLMPSRKITAPIDPFADAAAGLGFINQMPDIDGVQRKEMLLTNYQGLAYPSYTLTMAMLAQGIRREAVRALNAAESGRSGIQLGKTFVPTNSRQQFFVTFNAPETFPVLPFYDVLNDRANLSTVKDKIVLIGVSAAGVGIPHVTPVNRVMSTALFEANALQNILDQNFITRSSLFDLLELLVLVLIGVHLAVLLPRLKASLGALISLGILVLIVGAGMYLFIGPGIWVKITYPVLQLVLGYAAVTTARFLTSEVRRDQAEGESAEVNRMLGLSFQNQGQLDLAFDKFRRVPVDDGMKDILYNLGLDYERKRMFNKAISVYQYIGEADSGYKDIQERIKKLNVASDTMIFGGKGGKRTESGTLSFDDAHVLPTLGRYEITAELGKGAMGIVYKGRDPQIGRITAIKTIRFSDEYEADEVERIREQFFAEAKTAGMLSHPHIVTIYDAGTDHDLSYIAMEYLEGVDLKEYAKPDSLLATREVIRLVAEVAEALGYAHNKGVVHRDIKPANIMYLKNGMAKVTDFGIARAVASSKTKTGVVKGTPFYMSPEQITGKKVDGRSDIFSLGVVLYELLTGVQPFRAEDLTGLIYKITAEDPEPITTHNPKVPKALVQIINKALIKDRERRYQRAEQMAQHLRLVLTKMNEVAVRRRSARANGAERKRP